jgi:hypothetical protein
MQKRKKIMMMLIASMMIAAAMSQARAESISLEERLNTQGKLEATMLMMSKEQILEMLSVMMSASENLQERANLHITASDADLQGEFGSFGKLMDLIGQKSLEIESLSEDQKEEMLQAYLEAEQAYGLLIKISEKYQ